MKTFRSWLAKAGVPNGIHTPICAYFGVILASVSVACSSPTAPVPVTAQWDSPQFAPVAFVQQVPLAEPAAPIDTAEVDTLPQLLESPATCRVSAADLRRAQTILSLIVNRLTPARMEATLTERRSVRILRASLKPVADDFGARPEIWTTTLPANSLLFSSDRAAGWALWTAAAQVTLRIGVSVNGVPIRGCRPIAGPVTFTGTFDLTTRPKGRKVE